LVLYRSFEQALDKAIDLFDIEIVSHRIACVVMLVELFNVGLRIFAFNFPSIDNNNFVFGTLKLSANCSSSNSSSSNKNNNTNNAKQLSEKNRTIVSC
jgi:hypothetical protein